MSVHEPRVTSNARLRFSIFSNPSYFCMCNFVSGDRSKAHLALFPETKWHIQTCYTCRDIEKRSRTICYHTIVQYSCTSCHSLTGRGARWRITCSCRAVSSAIWPVCALRAHRRPHSGGTAHGCSDVLATANHRASKATSRQW